ncbi:MFS transporter [Prauserella cavernicola]|uniref:MFS transporter n=1 Tax=Prauserella cavernicola TaxID=2800127 RepID=A0A934V712_9PSEU|nr:MFS transporter [Prauserella cavernicola]MBK1787239.1 MFS transporter [Prauserella cavernicola]
MSFGSMRKGKPPAALDSTSGSPTNVRWHLFVLLLLVGTLSYIDRISLSVGMPLIAEEFDLDPAVQGILLSSFFWTYAAFQVPGGWLADRIGPRKVLTIAVSLWSFFQLLTGLAANMWMMLMARLGLGAAEAPQYPTGAKLSALWLPEKDRARGAVLMDSSSTLGAAVGSLVVAGLISLLGGWRESFVVVAVVTAGAGWVIWRFIRNTPREHPRANEAEIAYVEGEHAIEDERDAELTTSTKSAAHFLKFRTFWFMGIGFMAANMLFYGLLTFGPLYLFQERGLDIGGLAGASFAIYFSGFVGENVAGWIAQRWRRAGGSANLVMRTLIGVSALIATAAILAVAFVSDTTVAVVLLAATLFFGRFLGLYWSLPGTLTIRSRAGVLGGMMNLFSNIGGIIIPIITGFVVSATGSYFTGLIIFAGCGLVYLACSLAIDYSKKLPLV